MVAAAKRRRWASAPLAKAAPEPRLKVVKTADDPAVEQYLNRKCVEGALPLREQRGETFRKPKTKDQPHKVLDELDIMLSKGEISRPQHEAGLRYGDTYRRTREGVYRCSMNFTERRGNGVHYDWVMVGRVAIFAKLERLRRDALCGDRHMVTLCDRLLGEDWRIGCQGEARSALVADLSWALTRLAYHFGILWWRDDTA